MPQKQLPNLFVVNTPHQLLNAIEAAHSLQLTNNHLLVMKPTNLAQDRFTPLIDTKDWETVQFQTPYLDVNSWAERKLHPAAYRWYCRYLHFKRMRTLACIAKEFRNVDKLFLGHYFAEEKPFMLHLANTIKHNEVCLLDDGTDTIEINKRRHRLQSKAPDRLREGNAFNRIKRSWQAKYWTWQLEDPPSVTFFTVYKLDIRKGDRLLENNYSYVRSMAPSQAIDMQDTVIFIGQCMADDYFEAEALVAFLSEVGRHFAGKKVMFVAHPRESLAWINRIKEELHWEIWPSSSVIERDLIVRGIRPSAVAGFVSSALISLECLMDPRVEIVCFHIAQEHWLIWGEYAAGVYEYLEEKMRDRVAVVPLSLQSVNAGSALSHRML